MVPPQRADEWQCLQLVNKGYRNIEKVVTKIVKDHRQLLREVCETVFTGIGTGPKSWFAQREKLKKHDPFGNAGFTPVNGQI